MNKVVDLKVARLRPATLSKRDYSNMCFPVNFANFLRTRFYRTPVVVNSFTKVKTVVRSWIRHSQTPRGTQ